MSAPNRSAEVSAFVNGNRHLFTSRSGVDSDAIRREALIPLCQHLNGADGGKWGCLTKLDQGGKIPADIIVWKDTKEHFDVFTGADPAEDTQPMWGAHGPARAGWEWLEVAAGNEPLRPPTGSTESPATLEELKKLNARLRDLESTITSQAQRINQSESRSAALESKNAALEKRIEQLESKPDPTFELPELFVEGHTDRVLGHAHTINLSVRRR